MDVSILNDARSALGRAGITDVELSEVEDLVTRDPEDVSIAVIGPHNAGKTTLISVLTGDPRAAADISALVQTTTSVAYTYERGAAKITIWDTPGLGSEHLDHDQDARDRITKADAVVLAVAPDLVSEKARDQLAELLVVGRKRGAVLPVVTKADREPTENRPAITLTLREAFPEVGQDFEFVAAGEIFDAREAGEPEPGGTGVPKFRDALETLANGEARRRVDATAAVRLLLLCERAETHIATERPEHEAALIFQQRLRKILRRADRRIQEAQDGVARKLRLAAFRAVALIGQTIDAGEGREAIDVAVNEAWDSFSDETNRLAEQLAERLGEVLENAGAELSRLESGPLADVLRQPIEVAAMAMDVPKTPSDVDLGSGRQLLDAAQRASNLLSGAKLAVKGKSIPIGVIADIGLEAAAFIVDAKQAEAVSQAKKVIRSTYLKRAAEITEAWSAYVEELRGTTTGNALAQTEAAEQQLLAGLGELRQDLETLSTIRLQLSALVDTAIRSGYAEDNEHPA